MNSKIISFLTFFISFNIFADTNKKKIEVFTADNLGPMVIITSNILSGIVGEFLVESTEEHIIFEINKRPWPRAQLEALSKKNVILVPYSRNNVREKNAKWISKVYDDPICLFTVKPKKPIVEKEDMLKLNSIGILLGAAAYNNIKELGIDKKLVIAHKATENANKLMSGTIDAWVSSLSIAKYQWKQNHFEPSLLQCGKPISKYQQFVATSLKSDEDFVKSLSILMENYKKTDKFKKLLNRYGVTYSEFEKDY